MKKLSIPLSDDYFNDLRHLTDDYSHLYSPHKAAIRMCMWNMLYLLNFKVNRVKKHTDNIVHVAFYLAGGYGDYLLFANWFHYFYEKYNKNGLIEFTIIYSLGSAETIFNYPIENVSFVYEKEKELNYLDFDLSFHFCVLPKILNCDRNRIKKIYNELMEYVEVCVRFRQENGHILDMHPRLDGMGTAVAVINGKKRIQEADYEGFLGIDEIYRFPLRIDENEENYLSSLGLVEGKYITVHRGWDRGHVSNVKAWSLKSCGDMIPRLKAKYPKYKIVVIGSELSQAPQNMKGCDVNLIGNTTLDQVKILLKHAAVHVDNEGGMVHLRHALNGGPSVVLFGPTSDLLFGYSENENIKSNACSVSCEWLTSNWPLTCPRVKKGVPCMDNISIKQVEDAVERILS